MEILGFTPHQIREYIEKALDGNSTHIQKLVQHLEEHPVIEGYCYVPLHVAILVHIYLTMNGALPTTLYELFCRLVLCCIVRELETHDTKTFLSELSSLNDLPDDLKPKLSDLCVLAIVGVMQDKVVFYPKDLLDFCLSSNLPSLGLLQAVEGLTFNCKSCSYNFLHLSVQELLAAYHISQLDSSKQMEVFEVMFGSSRFQVVLHYYSGFTKLANPAIQDFISTYSKQQSSITDLLPLLHCFYEAQDLSLCSLVKSGFTENVMINFSELNPVDYLAVGYFITFLLSEPSYDASNICLKIEGTDFVCHKFKLLLLELSKKFSRRVSSLDSGWPRRLEIELNGMSITEEAAELIISHLKKLSVWSKLILRNCKIHGVGLLHIIEELQKTDYFHLTELQFVKTKMEDYYSERLQIGLNFKKLLERNKSLTHLDLSPSGSITEFGHYIFEGLEHNTTLVHLKFSNTIDDTAEVAFTTMLETNKTLTHLDLSGNYLRDCIFQALRHNTTLVHLNLSCIVLNGTSQVALTTMLEKHKTLTHLDLSRNYLRDCSIFQALQHNTTLVHLNLSNARLVATEDTAQALTTMLQVNKTLTHLDLSKNEAFLGSGRVVYYLCKGLRHNTTLHHLKLKNSGLKDNAKSQIRQAMDCNLTLDISLQLDQNSTGFQCNIM